MKLKLSSIQLLETHFIKVSIQALPGEHSGECRGLVKLEMKAEMEKPTKDSPNVWTILFSLSAEGDENCNRHAYNVESEAIGRIYCKADVESPESLEFIGKSGSSLVYGAIREMLANISARSVRSTFYLPTLDLSHIDVEVRPENFRQDRRSDYQDAQNDSSV